MQSFPISKLEERRDLRSSLGFFTFSISSFTHVLLFAHGRRRGHLGATMPLLRPRAQSPGAMAAALFTPTPADPAAANRASFLAEAMAAAPPPPPRTVRPPSAAGSSVPAPSVAVAAAATVATHSAPSHTGGGIGGDGLRVPWTGRSCRWTRRRSRYNPLQARGEREDHDALGR